MPHIYYISDKNGYEELISIIWCPERNKKDIEDRVLSMIKYYNKFNDFHISRVIVEKESYMNFDGEYKRIE